MIDINKLKDEIIELADEKKEDFEKISSYIHSNPELAFEEFKAQKVLTDYLEDNGFKVNRGICNLETSFEAIYENGEGKDIAFLAEYDALPEIDHACGHNLIGTSSMGAGIVLKEIMEKYDIKGRLRVVGTPAEENGSGKVLMIKEGYFKDIDAALLMHPTNKSMPDDISYSAVNIEYEFTGKSAHAAANPGGGINALSGLVLMFNAVDSQRLHFKDYSRVHGIILKGGTVDNVITEKALGRFNIRALNYDDLLNIIEVVNRCAEGAALATGTKVKIEQKGQIRKEVKNNKKIVEYVRNNMDYIGEKYIERTLEQGLGSTDMGNVTHEIPAIQFYIKLNDTAKTHTPEFEVASGNEYGKRNLNASVKVLGMSGLDIFLSEEQL